jgi:hypothetical protein
MCSIAQHIPRHGSKPQSQLCIICRLSSSSSYYSCSCVEPQWNHAHTFLQFTTNCNNASFLPTFLDYIEFTATCQASSM